MNTPKIDLYLGKITEVVDRVTYEIKYEVPGVGKDLRGFPLTRGEMDEPVEGNLIIVMSVDPIYNSVNFYTKLKENDFIGIRSNGKVIDITPDYINIGVYDESSTNPDETHTEADKSNIKMDNSGNIEINATGNDTIKISGDSSIEISGNSDIKISGDSKVEVSGNSEIKVSGNIKIESSGNTDIKASGSCTIDSPDVKITGASLTVNGTAAPSGSGPFCGIPACLFTGAPHVGNKSSGN